MKPLLAVLLLGLLLPGSPSPRAEPRQTEPVAPLPADADAVSGLIEQAEAARLRAAVLGAEWLKTRDLIEQARQAARLGDLEQAATLAAEALQQGELARAQAERESAAWQGRVVR